MTSSPANELDARTVAVFRERLSPCMQPCSRAPPQRTPNAAQGWTHLVEHQGIGGRPPAAQPLPAGHHKAHGPRATGQLYENLEKTHIYYTHAPIFFSMKAWWSASISSTTAGGVRLEVPAGSPCNKWLAAAGVLGGRQVRNQLACHAGSSDCHVL